MFPPVPALVVALWPSRWLDFITKERERRRHKADKASCFQTASELVGSLGFNGHGHAHAAASLARAPAWTCRRVMGIGGTWAHTYARGWLADGPCRNGVRTPYPRKEIPGEARPTDPNGHRRRICRGLRGLVSPAAVATLATEGGSRWQPGGHCPWGSKTKANRGCQ